MADENIIDEMRPDVEEVRKYTEKLKEKNEEDLLKIITRYIKYKPALVEAALFVSVEKGVISYDLKVSLAHQIFRNFTAHEKGIRQTRWEGSNAFREFVTRYSDDQLYDMIDDPSDIVIDVYHAVLLYARERELISEKDFNNYYSAAFTAGRTDSEIRQDEWINYIRDVDTDDVELSESEIETERSKYWKCPFCKQLVDIEFDQCWNCQAEKPMNPEIPDKEEAVKEYAYRNPKNLTKQALGAIGGGIVLVIIGFLHPYVHYYSHRRDYVLIVLGAIGIAGGIVMALSDLFRKSKE